MRSTSFVRRWKGKVLMPMRDACAVPSMHVNSKTQRNCWHIFLPNAAVPHSYEGPTLRHLQDARPTLLLVDDEATNLQVLRHTLHDRYRLLFAKDGESALNLVRSDRPDLILLDVMMPGLSGYDVCRRLKEDPWTSPIPVIFVTALADVADEHAGLELGAVDYITKPFNPHIVQARVRTHLSLVRADEVLKTRLHIVQCLGRAAEFKDNETGKHVIRMSHYAQIVALTLGYSEQTAQELLHAAPMHDIGKIGIPDAIL